MTNPTTNDKQEGAPTCVIRNLEQVLEDQAQTFLAFSQSIVDAMQPMVNALNCFTQALKGLTIALETPEPEWWPLHISTEGGGFGRFQWANGDNQFWGECWWDEEKGNPFVLGNSLTKVSNLIVEAFKEAQIDPTQAAKIKDFAKSLQAIKDGNDPLP